MSNFFMSSSASCRSMLLAAAKGKELPQLPWISMRCVGTQDFRLTSPPLAEVGICLHLPCPHRIIDCPELERTLKDHLLVQLVSLHWTTPKYTWEYLLLEIILVPVSTLCWGLLQLISLCIYLWAKRIVVFYSDPLWT